MRINSDFLEGEFTLTAGASQTVAPVAYRPCPVCQKLMIRRNFAGSSGIYGVLVATPDGVVAERYSDHGAPDRITPSFSKRFRMSANTTSGFTFW